MLIMLLLNVVVIALGGIFVWLPEVLVLPNIVGYNIDGALITGMGYVNRVFEVLWPLAIMWAGFLYLMAYYIIKMGVKFLLGHRAP